MTPARLKPRPLDPESSALTMRPTHCCLAMPLIIPTSQQFYVVTQLPGFKWNYFSYQFHQLYQLVTNDNSSSYLDGMAIMFRITRKLLMNITNQRWQVFTRLILCHSVRFKVIPYYCIAFCSCSFCLLIHVQLACAFKNK